jgi:hypothetical protein
LLNGRQDKAFGLVASAMIPPENPVVIPRIGQSGGNRQLNRAAETPF